MPEKMNKAWHQPAKDNTLNARTDQQGSSFGEVDLILQVIAFSLRKVIFPHHHKGAATHDGQTA